MAKAFSGIGPAAVRAVTDWAFATIYRKQIRPVLVQGADFMDGIFPVAGREGSLLTWLLGAHPCGRWTRRRVCELVGVAGFEPAASSSRTRYARVQSRWPGESAQVSGSRPARMPASDRT